MEDELLLDSRFKKERKQIGKWNINFFVRDLFGTHSFDEQIAQQKREENPNMNYEHFIPEIDSDTIGNFYFSNIFMC
jgi:hypothetical protein